MASLPPDLLRRVENVTVVVRRRPAPRDLRAAGVPAGDTLLGLYTGIPLTHRGSNYHLVTPDHIAIFQEPIEDLCRTDEEVRDQVRKTVLHELGHYFGIDDHRLHQLGLG